ncbi:glycine betaine ABC transporter substrate-binding protein [Oceanobacter kriegii]|uniref:glycine betaine ABC transporter substrate-binding protein n=1 Tax=Oceanobacter kriegii TaxID=64972 RepID=UPI00040CDFFC|nr:glycine betaine ABC transporter substrate-binding protein [Oceanobacter kriegii]
MRYSSLYFSMLKASMLTLALTPLVGTSSVQATTLAPASNLEPDSSGQCRDVRLGQVAWTDLQVVTAIADILLDRIGYQSQVKDLASLGDVYQAMSQDELDVFMGYWQPSQQSMAAPYIQEGDFAPVATNMDQARMTLAVPAYVYDQGIHTLADLARNKDKFEGRIYGAEAGSSAHQKIHDMINKDAFGLGDFKLIETSERIMLAQLKGRIKKGEWVVILGWSPHPMNQNFDIRYLGGGDDYFGPQQGKASVSTNMRPEFDQRCQNVARLMRNLQFDASVEETIMDQVSNEFVPLQRAVRIWMHDNPGQIQQWLSGVTTADGGAIDVPKLTASLKVGWGRLQDD